MNDILRSAARTQGNARGSIPVLTRFVQAYQRVEPLTIGELWAVAITLRIVLVENMRRLSVQIIQAMPNTRG